jgi:hypothetical protein
MVLLCVYACAVQYVHNMIYVFLCRLLHHVVYMLYGLGMHLPHPPLCAAIYPEAFGTKQVNFFFRGIYQNDALMKSEKGKELSDALYNFISAYLWEASAAYRDGVAAFPRYPKLHAVHEVAFIMRRQCRLYPYCQNPCVHACATDEDFIGRCAALSRCVSPKCIPMRTLQRYLCHLQILWARV